MSDLGGEPIILHLSDENIEEVINAERAVLIFTKSDCGHCTAYQAEIEALYRQGQMEGISIGKVVLNQRGITHYKRENPWLGGLKFLPYTLLYSEGVPMDDFAASKGTYLLERIESAFVEKACIENDGLNQLALARVGTSEGLPRSQPGDGLPGRGDSALAGFE